MAFFDPVLWAALAKIVGVNIVLSGDNAVVIALAARSLPRRQQKQAIFWGSAAAIAMRILLTLFAAALLTLPYLKLVGSVLLLWIGVKLLIPDDGDEEIAASDNMLTAIKTILVADLVMSVDNVIAVAAAAEGHDVLMIAGLAISIPLVIFGATILLKLMERWPIIITIGAGLLGFVAGEMAWQDSALDGLTSAYGPSARYIPAIAGTALVVIVGRILAGRTLERAAREQLENLEAVEHPRQHARKEPVH